jgi:hypothetical protein
MQHLLAALLINGTKVRRIPDADEPVRESIRKDKTFSFVACATTGGGIQDNKKGGRKLWWQCA